MSNFHALGFVLQNRQDAEALARAPIRYARKKVAKIQKLPVMVHRFELGGGIELWTIVQWRDIRSSYPAFCAREPRRFTVEGTTCPHTPFTGHLAVTAPVALSCHLSNYPFYAEGKLSLGDEVDLHLTALLPHGVAAADGEPGLAMLPSGGLAKRANRATICGEVIATERLENLITKREVVWARLDAGADGLFEVVGAAEDMGAAEVGQRVTGEGTLRGYIAEMVPAGE